MNRTREWTNSQSSKGKGLGRVGGKGWIMVGKKKGGIRVSMYNV